MKIEFYNYIIVYCTINPVRQIIKRSSYTHIDQDEKRKTTVNSYYVQIYQYNMEELRVGIRTSTH